MNQVIRTVWGAAAAVAVATSLASAQSITSVGALPAELQSFADGVSGDGNVVVGRSGRRAFRWTSAGGIEDLGVLPGQPESAARAASHTGAFIAGFSGPWHAVGNTAVRWNAGAIQSLGMMPNGQYTRGYGISGDGSVVVGDSRIGLDTVHAFRWKNGVMSNIGTLPGMERSFAYGVSSDGTIVVGYSSSQSTGARAVRWTLTGGPQDIGRLPGDTQAIATAVSGDGLVVVGNSSDANHSRVFRWTSTGGMVDLGPPAGNTSAVAWAVSGDGSAIVGQFSGFTSTEALLWTPTLGMVDLNTYLPTIGIDLTGWKLLSARGISADGQTIVGWGEFNDVRRGFVVTLSLPDTDGDGIPDDWEINGIPYTDINGIEQRYMLPGADPMRKNLYVEVDSMNGLSFTHAAAAEVIAAFANAPVKNPVGGPGIILHIQHDDVDLPYVQVWQTSPNDCMPLEFYNYRGNHFGTAAERGDPSAAALLKAKAKAFRYCIVADLATPEEIGGCGETPGDNFVIYHGTYRTTIGEAAVFMHELGHNLGLKHGGCDKINGKPNYPSIMNYVLAYKQDWNREFWKLDYSRVGNEELQNLNETSLNEITGIGKPTGKYSSFFMPFGVNVDEGGTIKRKMRYVLLDGSEVDFGNVAGTGFRDGIYSASVAQDLNYLVDPPAGIKLPTAPSPGQPLCTQNDWAVVAQNMKTSAAIGPGAPAPTFPDDELTLDAILWMDDNFPMPPPVCYANCDRSEIEPKLNVDDFTCFINAFAAAQTLSHAEQVSHYANCDRSTIAPVLNVDDFTCFITRFAEGCD